MSNQAGEAYAFMSITPILKGREVQLRAYLEAFTQTTSPFARLTQTHFARWVILSDWVDDPSQPSKDHLDSEYLIFTSNLDGPLERYLDELCGLSEAEAVWSDCAGSPTPAAGAPLKTYLLHNQIDIGFFVGAYDNASVAKVKASLALREQLIAFAVRSQGMDPIALQSAFLAEFAA